MSESIPTLTVLFDTVSKNTLFLLLQKSHSKVVSRSSTLTGPFPYQFHPIQLELKVFKKMKANGLCFLVTSRPPVKVKATESGIKWLYSTGNILPCTFCSEILLLPATFNTSTPTCTDQHGMIWFYASANRLLLFTLCCSRRRKRK